MIRRLRIVIIVIGIEETEMLAESSKYRARRWFISLLLVLFY